MVEHNILRKDRQFKMAGAKSSGMEIGWPRRGHWSQSNGTVIDFRYDNVYKKFGNVMGR